MINNKDEHVLKSLTEKLVTQINKKNIIKSSFNPESILFEIYALNNNRKSRLFQQSAELFLPNNMRNLRDLGLVQELDISGTMNYTLSFQGLVEAIEKFYGISKNQQFQEFLSLTDEKYQATTETGELNWREKLVLISLLTLGCVSPESAMTLDNELNQQNYQSYLVLNIEILEKHKIFSKHYELPETRGEPPSTLLMRSRVNDLPRKTNHIYKYMKGTERSKYYLDILDNNNIDVNKTNYLLKKIFKRFNPETNYQELNTDLINAAKSFQTKFISLSINSRTLIQVSEMYNNFFQREIWELK